MALEANSLVQEVRNSVKFLVRDDQPLLFHPGSRAEFVDVKAAVASLIDV